MTGGLRETASRLAIAAMFCVMGTAVFGAKPVHAADLGGDCCADLEERVAELEATTVRKGNKKVSVQVYGKVNKAVEYWDDGAEQNTYVVDNSYETTRMGFKGTAKISGNWGAGYKLEFETRDASSEALNQIDDDNTPQARGVFVRHSYMFINNKDLGEVRWGLTYTPKDDITKDTNVTDLQDTMNSDDHMNRGFFLRPKGFNTEVGGSGQLKWQNISGCYTSGAAFDCSTRRNQVTYWSPDWNGLTASWGWGEDDIWGGALRYKKEWGYLAKLAPASAMKNLPTSVCRLVAAVLPISSATFKSGRARARSSTNRRAYSSSALGASRRTTTATASMPASSPIPVRRI